MSELRVSMSVDDLIYARARIIALMSRCDLTAIAPEHRTGYRQGRYEGLLAALQTFDRYAVPDALLKAVELAQPPPGPSDARKPQ